MRNGPRVYGPTPLPIPLIQAQQPAAAIPLDAAAVHARYAEFVWLSLQRLGALDADIEDVLQEVFVVVHRRLDSFDGSSRLTTWLFGICMRVMAAYRRRAYRRREQSVAELPESAMSSERDPHESLVAREARARLLAALDRMDLERRAVFVMFELDDMSCDEIAEILGVPVGTVYSRLHAARKEFQKALARLDAERPTAFRRSQS
jgi:RNA polymerase sigma-70 factor (ECF subfamily)